MALFPRQKSWPVWDYSVQAEHKYFNQCSLAEKRHYEHGNSYDKFLIGACLQFQKFSKLSSW